MPFEHWLPHSAAQGWLFLPVALLLGALHGLEPGHSKTMMAAFIVAVRGTVRQAVLLGLSAAVSHTALVWIVALGGRYFWGDVNAAADEPYFQIAAGLVVFVIAAWMMRRVWQQRGGYHDHDHAYDNDYRHHGHRHAEHAHAHNHVRATAPDARVLDAVTENEGMDAHERAHAAEIARRFGGGSVTTAQIIGFGLAGGLIPCPAAVTVLLLCLQLKAFALAIALVFCFSIGVASTMIAAGVIAAYSLRHIRNRWPGFERLARRAPYASGVLMLLVGLYMVGSGWLGLAATAAL